jgi:Cft2 family RNA processing exonuclease
LRRHGKRRKAGVERPFDVFSLVEKSLYLADLNLWVDSMRARERGYVSHGHSDHAREHATVVATPNTAAICRVRFGKRAQRPAQISLLAKRPPRPPCTFEERAMNVAWDEGAHRLTLFSAGHVLGSSQLLVEGERGRFVYTGDFKLADSLTCEPTEVKRCDVVLMECTFGRAHYVFPPREELHAEMIAFARGLLEAGGVPIFYAYSLGKAQEAIAILGGAGLPITVHPSVAAISDVYVAQGVALPPYVSYDEHTYVPESVLIWPPSSRGLPKALRHRHRRTAVLTGWALDRSASYRYGADRAFALSDHADYPSLLRYLELAQPRKVLLNHGFPDFVHRVRTAGFDAEYLEEHAQLALF